MVDSPSYTFSLGDTLIELQIQDDTRLDLSPPISNFLSQGQAEIYLSMSYRQWPQIELGKPFFESGATWSLYKVADQWVIRLRSTGDRSYGIGIFSKDFSRGETYFRPLEKSRLILDPIRHPMGDLFFVHLLSRGKGALLHACSVIYNQVGVVFPGRGGVGKSTTARLWLNQPGCTVLGDDRVILRQQDGRFWIYGTPWPGTEGICNQGKAPLKALYFLRQARENRVRLLKPSDIVARLMVASFVVRWDHQAVAYTLELFEQLARQIPCYEFSFVSNQSAVDFIRDQIG